MRRLDGPWRLSIALAVFIALVVGMLIPDWWHAGVRIAIVGLVTGILVEAAIITRRLLER